VGKAVGEACREDGGNTGTEPGRWKGSVPAWTMGWRVSVTTVVCVAPGRSNSSSIFDPTGPRIRGATCGEGGRERGRGASGKCGRERQLRLDSVRGESGKGREPQCQTAQPSARISHSQHREAAKTQQCWRGHTERPLEVSCRARPHHPLLQVDHPHAPAHVGGYRGHQHGRAHHAIFGLDAEHRAQGLVHASYSRYDSHRCTVPLPIALVRSLRTAQMSERSDLRHRSMVEKAHKVTSPLSLAAPPGCKSTNLSMEYLLGLSNAPMPATCSPAISVAFMCAGSRLWQGLFAPEVVIPVDTS
jgi:hypothetical protein